MFRPFHVVVVVLIALSITEVASAREKTGLVLSGGGARGFAHVAVLEALEADVGLPAAVDGPRLLRT